MQKLALGVAALAAVLVSCEGGGGEEQASKKLVLGQKKVDCALTIDALPGTDWVIDRINEDKTTTADPGTRARFFKDGDTIKVKYNVASLSDMYTYTCEKKGEELQCLESPKLKDFCQALAVAEGSACTPEKLRELAPKATDEEITKAIAEANETIAKYKDKPEWKQFAFNNNNLGNKLQGRLDARIDTRACNVLVTDMYRTIYNGKMVEDANPVGTNNFVKTEEELLWEHCTDSGDLFARKSKDFPEKEADIQGCFPPGCTFSTSEETFYHYLGQDGRPAVEGCTYSFDLWLNGKPHQKDVPAELVDYKGKKEVRWVAGVKHAAPGAYVMTMIRHKTCNGQKEQLEVSCNLANVQ